MTLSEIEQLNVDIGREIFGYQHIGYYASALELDGINHGDPVRIKYVTMDREAAEASNVEYYRRRYGREPLVYENTVEELCYWKEGWGTLHLPDFASDMYCAEWLITWMYALNFGYMLTNNRGDCDYVAVVQYNPYYSGIYAAVTGETIALVTAKSFLACFRKAVQDGVISSPGFENPPHLHYDNS